MPDPSLTRHHALISRVRDRCARDPELVAALMYGSFASAAGATSSAASGATSPDASGAVFPAASGADEHSDIEFWLFHSAAPDPYAWTASIEPPLHIVRNEFGAHVAIFAGLIRGEFHFAPAASVAEVATWPATTTVEILKGSVPAPAAPPDLEADICGRFANWLLLAWHVGRRGELLRQRDALAHAQRHLLWMARLATGRTQHWPTPSRAAEADLPPSLVAALSRTHDDVAAAWHLGRTLWHQLDPSPPAALVAELDRLLP